MFYTIDSDGDNISYYIDWGDGNVTDWIGPYASGDAVAVSHTWTEKGIYFLRCKAKDHPYEHESDWFEAIVKVPPKSKTLNFILNQEDINKFEVVILRSKIIQNTLFLQFLEHFPLLQQLFIIFS